MQQGMKDWRRNRETWGLRGGRTQDSRENFAEKKRFGQVFSSYEVIEVTNGKNICLNSGWSELLQVKRGSEQN